MLVLAPDTAQAQAPSLVFGPNAILIDGGNLPVSEVLTVVGDGGAVTFSATASVTTPAGSNWLSVSPTSGVTPLKLFVTANGTGLAIGTYFGSITIVGDASNSPLTVPVTLGIGSFMGGDPPARLVVSPVILSFSQQIPGETIADPQPPEITAIVIGGGGIDPFHAFTTSITTQDSGSWLSVSPATGNTPVTLTASVDPAGLVSGTYFGAIAIDTDVRPTPQLVIAQLIVQELPKIGMTPTSLQFLTPAGSNPEPQTFQVENVGGETLGWTSVVATEPQGNWLAVSPATGVAPSTLTVSVNSAGLNAGTYTGSITITAVDNASNSPQVLPVELAVGVPSIGQNGVVNGASFSTEAVVSPGSISSLFGTNLATETVAAVELPLPRTLAGTQVLVNDVPAPLFFVSPFQINFQMPPDVSGTTAELVVVSAGVRGLPEPVSVSPERPGIFTAVSGGTGQGAVLNQDFTFNSSQNPAAAGSVIQVFATGLGATDPPSEPGEPAGASPLSNTITTPDVLIGGIPADVFFSGLAPGFVGLYQVNVGIPAGTAPGAEVSLVLIQNGISSNTVSIAVQ
ncbi:MAG: hypothetical protein O7E51_08760 [Acidobacteria bacterium]|nr:hypothetical protein [Acidobacteriota bacterium]